LQIAGVDTLNAPSDPGDLPGGWNAPSINAPNPAKPGRRVMLVRQRLMRRARPDA